ncbi:UDP-glycosyltransferase 75D1 [Apostasia shenzhenica]|uniref:Glycosyltransferase n=1 Tax=Apostasia shenzhenica TaxID=1088818 RepID=A0A2I0B9Q1_9ASPA|nr:UDP-glycosyltransferase 75D1 [Apostasia shenzhenica]
MEIQAPHFLILSYPAQGHINPNLRLAKRLAREAAASAGRSVHITFSTAVSAHRQMFPSSGADRSVEHDDGISFIPYSNGYDDGFDKEKHDVGNYMTAMKRHGAETLAAIVDDLASGGHPVTCLIYSFFMSWAADIARDRGIPCFLHWIQPATAFAVYWHAFHDCGSAISAAAGDLSGLVKLPELPPMRVRDLPSFLTLTSSDDPYAILLPHLREMFETLDAEAAVAKITKPRVLVNTADVMEAPAMASVAGSVEIAGVGPLLGDATEGSILKEDENTRYMEWLDGQAAKSVVYVSFGSMSVLKKEQMEEIKKGLRASGRPYLWVVRKDNRLEGLELEEQEEEEEQEDGEYLGEKKKGMVVEWCSQARVLAHRAVGCFVTHCGWNSTVESLIAGVPTVAVPQWTDQTTNAWLMERAWGTGVRVEVGREGTVPAEELRRCVETAMGEEIRRKAAMWMEKVRDATREGGLSDRNVKSFVEEIIST